MSEQGNAPWYSGYDDELKGVAQNHGWDKLDLPEAAKASMRAFHETQKKLGIPADRVLRIPDAADAAGWKTVHQKLGVPETPEGYDFSTVKRADGSAPDENLIGFVRGEAARLNITKDAAAAFAAALVKRDEDGASAGAVRDGAAQGVARQELAASWGPNLEANNFTASRTAGMMGFDPDFIAALPAAKYVPFMQKMLEAGNKMGEAQLFGLGGGAVNGQTVRTREGALARIEELKHDKAWYARWKGGEAEANREWDNLNSLLVQRAG